MPCFDSVEEYAKKLNIKYQDRMELLKHSEIIKMFEKRIESLQRIGALRTSEDYATLSSI